MKHAFKVAALLLLGAGVAGCDIGEGNTIEKIEVVPVTSGLQLGQFEEGDTHKLFQCFRDELIAVATFTDGTRANFSSRVTWSTSDAAVVEVSNRDIPAVFATDNPAADGSFYVHPTLMFVPGTVVPKGAIGETAVVTARFTSLSGSINLEIRKPTLRIVPAPSAAPAPAVNPIYMGEGTTQRLAVLGDVDGRTATPTELSVSPQAPSSQNGFNINPFRWILAGGTFEARDTDVAGDFDKWYIASGADRVVTLDIGGGQVTGIEPSAAPYVITAEQQLCPGGDVTLRPTTNVDVVTFYDDPGTQEYEGLVLSREAGLRVSGFLPEDLVAGTNEQLQLRGRLDVLGDGSQIEEQHLNAQGRYTALPLNNSCEVADDLLGCTTNSSFAFIANAQLFTASGAAEGGTARGQACLPLCRPAQATLTSDATVPVAANTVVNFTATALNVPPDVDAADVRYAFDFGDGVESGLQVAPAASHAYALEGAYTATARIVDVTRPAEFLSQNAGAVRVLVAASTPAGNTAPTASLTLSSDAGAAPLNVLFNAAESGDANTDDAVTVYEFDFGDGSPVVRQNSPTATHVYVSGTGSPFTPKIRVYDESALASTVVNGSPIEVTGQSPAFIRSNVVSLRARKATLCAVEVRPPLAAAVTEAAFTFSGTRFNAVGSFVADTDTDACTDPVIGQQDVTRFMNWVVFPAGVTDEVSPVAVVGSTATDFQPEGGVFYLSDVAAPTPLDITVVPRSPFSSEIEPTPSQLTVTPCTTCTP